ncbi:MAG: phenylalanine--tRNA ligase subunit alpha [Puniceicoccales bacterium]|jgi:phenylalanyl-tRNA synthetase alpha chain|nr:phenylalanine--tRNA ligase subunit alpha [Puniceicoccales bacterium]
MTPNAVDMASLVALADDLKQEVAGVTSFLEIDQLRTKIFGNQGVIRLAMKSLASLPVNERPPAGKVINNIKIELERLVAEKAEEIEASEFTKKLETEQVEFSIDGYASGGTLHPITQAQRKIEEIFSSIGFTLARETEIETEWFCFEALNTPENHPARDEMDTFFLQDDIRVSSTSKHLTERYLLRSHTSTVQIRTMLKEKPPLKIIAPGRTFRRDTVDATHSANFHQCEGLYVAEGVTVCDLKATLGFLLRGLFGDNIKVRLRPSFFPFTEPSFEVDMLSQNLGTLSNKWIEVLGCGMVDPEVFKAVGYDYNQLSGFAFGVGLERIAMLLQGIDDVRMFYQNDLRFLNQFA